jgi:predicted O-linked N-acetylglucosamine transferase (SPINDLY family)
MDYRITDVWADPVGDADRRHTESLLRLEDGFLCYKPPLDAPPVSPPPALQTGIVTFGSFNALAKITPLTIELWSRILNGISGSRLLLKNNSLHDRDTRELLSKRFSEHGVGPEQLQLHGWHADARDHLRMYDQIDIGLDTFPYNGTTTTCEALWMGVPVITLAGRTHAGRVGTSLLSRLGLSEWIADSSDEYHDIAMRTARDVERLSSLRTGLRTVISRSTLCDGRSFAKRMESTYRTIWQKWCGRASGA